MSGAAPSRPVTAAVLRNAPLAGGMTELVLSAPGVFAAPVAPGMFAHLLIPNAPQHVLRRPISIMDADAGAKTLTLGIRPKGEGTRLLCALPEGSALDLLAPLGRGFDLGGARTLWLVGGGVGAAPLLYAAKEFGRRADVTAFLGFRTASMACALAGFEAAGRAVLCTDDGSAGLRGTVIDAMNRRPDRPDLVMACGPVPMLKAARDFCAARGIRGQLSLEQRMGCGYGACLTCACKTRDGGREAYERVCADGPVFDAERVAFDSEGEVFV